MLKLSRKTLLAIGIVGVNLAAVTLPYAAHATGQAINSVINLTVSPVLISYSPDPSGTVTLGVVPSAGGLQSIASDTVTGDTNDTSGLTITLAENSPSSTDMISGSNTIPTSSGTPAVPVLEASNTWGWRIDSLAGFGSGPTGAVSSASPSATLKFAAIPANASPYTIDTTATNGSASSTIWYGANVTTGQPTGVYSTTVLYTITLN
ncbi:MAG TPA: hypothetical protein VMS08_01295 [Candidatus Saccharimonadia bacterium]|nr:hypothetical protein [Candidatus Saccharimonadia bacterium]